MTAGLRRRRTHDATAWRSGAVVLALSLPALVLGSKNDRARRRRTPPRHIRTAPCPCAARKRSHARRSLCRSGPVAAARAGVGLAEKMEALLTPALGERARYVALPHDGGHQIHADPAKPGKNGNLYDISGPLLAEWMRKL